MQSIRSAARGLAVAALLALASGLVAATAQALDGPVVMSAGTAWTGSRYPTAGISVVGDSLTRNALDPIVGRLSATGRPVAVNAQGGRNLEQSLPWINDLKQQGRLGPTVVIALGTNDVYADVPTLNRRIKAVLDAAAPRRVVWVVGYRSTELVGSARVEKVAAEWDRATARLVTVRWGDVVRREPGVLGPDRIHLTAAGSDRYAYVISRAVALYGGWSAPVRR